MMPRLWVVITFMQRAVEVKGFAGLATESGKAPKRVPNPVPDFSWVAQV
jgi:hypothetical protein